MTIFHHRVPYSPIYDTRILSNSNLLLAAYMEVVSLDCESGPP